MVINIKSILLILVLIFLNSCDFRPYINLNYANYFNNKDFIIVSHSRDLDQLAHLLLLKLDVNNNNNKKNKNNLYLYLSGFRKTIITGDGNGNETRLYRLVEQVTVIIENGQKKLLLQPQVFTASQIFLVPDQIAIANQDEADLALKIIEQALTDKILDYLTAHASTL